MKEVIRKYRQSINQPFTPKAFIILAGTLIPLLILPIVILSLGNQPHSQQTNAQEKIVKQEEKNDPEPEFLSNEFLIKVKKSSKGKIKENNVQDTGISALDEIGKQQKIKRFEKTSKAGKKSNTDADIFSWYVITLEGQEGKISGKFDRKRGILKSDNQGAIIFQENISRLRADKDIETVEPNFIVTSMNVPNDPYYSSTGSWGQSYPDLWGLKKINMEAAWDQATGSSTIIVADIDTGVDRNHEDLSSNMWVNSGETPNNGVDDDGNGYIDDYYGWDYVNNDNDPMDDYGHGTHTAGTITATGNNGVGVVGVNWTSKIMALKFLNNSGSGATSNAIKALQYAADMGAKVSSNSWGGNYYSTALDDAIKYEHEHGMVIVVAAGNSNADALNYSPASADYAITVAASDQNDLKASFSNWGEKIDVSAPGVDILSTRASTNPMCTADKTVGTNYCRVSGTSMATPHVAGLVALLLAKNPALNNEEVRQILRMNATDLGASGKDKNFGYGRINAGSTLLASSSAKPLTPIISSPASRNLVSASELQIIGSATGENFANYKVEIGSGRTPASWTLVDQSSTQINNGVLATINTADYSDDLYTIRLTATDSAGKSYQFQIYDVTIDNFDAAIQFPIGFISKGTLDIMGTAQVKNALTFGSYKIEWGQGSSPAVWSIDGITLKNSGTLPVTEGILAAWNTSSLTADQVYTLRLTVSATNGKTVQYLYQETIDKDMVSNWPKYLPGRGDGYDYVVPVLSDLDGDGSKEIIALETTTNAGKIHVFKKDGTSLPGFPFNLLSSDYSPHWSVNVDDLDNDGKKEIIFPGGQRIYIVKSDGSNYPGWPKQIFNNWSNALSQDRTPLAVDLNADGKKELVTMDRVSSDSTAKTATFKFHVLNLDGSELSGFPKTHTLPIDKLFIDEYASLSSSDMDNDGKPEFGFGYYRSFYLFDSNGNLLAGWPYLAALSTASDGPVGVAMIFKSPGAFGDIDGDGAKEVFALAPFDGICVGGCKSRLYAWKKDGTVLSGWPKQVGFPNWTTSRLNSPSLADIDNNNTEEVLAGANGIYAFDSAGLKFTETSHVFPAQSAPAIRDVNGDGKLEISSVNYRNIAVVTDNGQYYWQRNFSDDGHYFQSPGILADVDNNGMTEYAVYRAPQFGKDKISSLYLWELPLTGSISAQKNWPMFGHDSVRTGNLSNSSPIITPAPTSVLTSTPVPPTLTPLPTSTPVPTATPKPPTPTPASLTISNILATNITADTAKITWSTSVQGTSRIVYGTRSNNLNISTPLDSSLVISHAVTLSGLKRNTTHYYRVYSKNTAGTEFSSPTQSFRTLK